MVRGKPRGFFGSLARLREAAVGFDEPSRTMQRLALRELEAQRLPSGEGLAAYHGLLLFLCAHPGDAALLRAVESEFRRIARHVRALPAAEREGFVNEGLPFADTLTRFSHDCVRQLLARRDLHVRLDHAGEPRLELNTVLRLTLPAPEWSHTTAGLGDEDLLAALGVTPARRLGFLVHQLARLDREPFVKDHLFDALDLFVRVSPRGAAFSKARTRLPMSQVFWQRERLKRFDTLALMNRALPAPRRLDPEDNAELVRIIRDTLTLTCRETDPGTYLEPRSLRVHDLERGISVALYGMVPERQLPYESYVGFMLFKNGLPAAYGGSWVFGARADFGMNIFEPYRGGESGFMMCQVLRTYRQVFGVRYFEVDAHQFGLDNPDGIASGAFWFYHRHGFRPVDAALARLAEREARRLAAHPGARSSEKTLHAFTGSPVALNFGGPVPMALGTLGARITRMIARQHRGDRRAAEAAAVERLQRLHPTGAPQRAATLPGAARVMGEMALLGAAMQVDDSKRLTHLRRMAALKPRDLLGYQRALVAFLGQG